MSAAGPSPPDQAALQALLANARRVSAEAQTLRSAAAADRDRGTAVTQTIGGTATGADKEAYEHVTACAKAMEAAADQMQQLAAQIQRAVAHAQRPAR